MLSCPLSFHFGENDIRLKDPYYLFIFSMQYICKVVLNLLNKKVCAFKGKPRKFRAPGAFEERETNINKQENLNCYRSGE